jgi:hypothetical protein
MAIGRPLQEFSQQFNTNYNITLDVSGWDKTTFQIVAPMLGTLFIYGSLDGGALQGVRQGSPLTATNFQPVLATNLATGTAASTATGAGTYSVTNNNQYLRLQGSPAGAGANIYRLYVFNQKID